MLENITAHRIAPAKDNAAAELDAYELLNPDSSQPFWHLVTSEALVEELKAAGAKNIVHSLMATTKDICDQLRAIGSKIRVVCVHNELDFDICDSLTAARFAISINTFADEYVSWANYLIEHYTADANPDAILTLCEHISHFPNAFEREEIAKTIGKATKTAKATIVREINSFLNTREKDLVQQLDDDENVLPAWMDAEMRDFYWRHGWVNRTDKLSEYGIYFSSGNGPQRRTNFVLNPVVHIKEKNEQDNRRLTELSNGISKPVLEMPTRGFTSMEFFDNMVSSEGNFYTLDGFAKSHLNKLKAYYLGEYPECYELKQLGWQREGFYSFSNMIYQNGLLEYNKYGYAEIDGVNYLSMSASNVLEGVRQGDDIYENDKYLCYNKSPIDFEKWCELMLKVYPDHGMMSVTYALMACFRDVLFKRNRNFPHLYFYGPVGSGKSKIAESVCHFFTFNMPMWNLKNGTDYSFFAYLERFVNVAVGLNEFDENLIRQNWFDAIKGAFDGEGRHKGSGQKNKTVVQKINTAIVMVGQFLTTKDDSAVLIRTLPCYVAKKEDRTEEQNDWFRELREVEKKGISSLICEVLPHRKFLEENFIPAFNRINAELFAAMKADGITPAVRTLENFSVALATAQVLGQKLRIGFTYGQFLEYCKKEMAKINEVIGESNTLGQFWKTVEFMLDQGIISHGQHFKIETHSDVLINQDRAKTIRKTFGEPKKLLFLRLGPVHQLYMKELRQQTGTPGQNEQTIISYIKSLEAYVGNNPGSSFTSDKGVKQNTSSYVLDYDLLGANLERYRDDALKTVTLTGTVYRDAEIKPGLLGEEKVNFTLVQDESYTNDGGHQVKNILHTYCTYDSLADTYKLKAAVQVRITGTLNETKIHDKIIRRVAVSGIEYLNGGITNEEQEAAF